MQDFIFKPGIWLGEGTIALTTSPELIKFFTKWEITSEANQLIEAKQIIQMQGVKQSTLNIFTFMNITPEGFDLTIKNQYIEQVTGKGTRGEKLISWKFPQESALAGGENYTNSKNNELLLQAEYGSEQYRTTIEGILWKKSN